MSMPKGPSGLVALIAGWALLLPAAPARAEDTITVGKADAASTSFLPVHVGDQTGIFKRHGLVLKISDFTGGSKLSQAIVAGAIDVGLGAGAEADIDAAGNDRLRQLAAAGEVGDFEREPVLLEDADLVADMDRQERGRGRIGLADRDRILGANRRDRQEQRPTGDQSDENQLARGLAHIFLSSAFDYVAHSCGAFTRH
jgi:hypothetical protein